MRAIEFHSELRADQTLALPAAAVVGLRPGQRVRVLLLVEDGPARAKAPAKAEAASAGLGFGSFLSEEESPDLGGFDISGEHMPEL
jgi:hypothetical protein